MIQQLWTGRSNGERFGLIAGVALIVVLFVGTAVALLRSDYQVVFSELAPADAALMVAELERMKIPYRLGEGGASILVDRDIAHKTRIKLMGKNLPLHGAVGFELFNTSDFGMTEFAQKVNYQRALQGELTRTILSLSEVQDARVHLVLPEEGLFRRTQGSAKASITMTLKQGMRLSAEQVLGIQRLVAASVPGIALQDVTIIDQHGLALNRAAQTEPGGELQSGRLDLKKETETHLARKANEVLERAFGPGQALVSVDVSLNVDQVRTTTEDVIGAPVAAGQQGAGIMTREREITQDGAAPLDRAAGDSSARRAGNGSTQREVEYAVGRRVEQIVTAPGSIRRLQVVAVLAKGLDASQTEPVKELLAAAVGASKERGDTVVVYAFDAARSAAGAPASPAAAAGAAALAAALPSNVERAVSDVTQSPAMQANALRKDRVLPDLGWQGLVGLGLLVVVLLMWWWARRPRVVSGAALGLSESERHKALAEVRVWLQAGAAPAPTVGKGAQP